MSVSMKEIEENYIQNRSKLVNNFKGMMGGRHAAEDVVQDAYERVIKYRDRCNPDDLSKWVYVVVKNCARDAMKKEKMVDAVEFDEFDFHAKPFRTDILRLKNEVNAIIESKGHAVQDILTMFVIQDFSAKEIYDLTEYKADQIKMAIYRFRKEMKELYERSK